MRNNAAFLNETTAGEMLPFPAEDFPGGSMKIVKNRLLLATPSFFTAKEHSFRETNDPPAVTKKTFD